MNPLAVNILVGLIAYVLSVVTTSFIIGVKWGKLTSDVDNMKTDLAEIKGMFRLTLKEL